MKKHQEEEAKRDMTWEEFLMQYEQHIEGKVDASLRTANRPDEYAQPDEVAQKVDGSEADAKSKFTSIESAGGKSRGTNRDLISSKGGTAGGSDKYDIPNNCKLDLLKAARIQKLEENYMLMAHPYPQMEGELLLFQANIEDQSGENTTYRDYSLVKRRAMSNTGKLI